MPYLDEKGRFWAKVVKSGDINQVIFMFKNSAGRISPYSTSGRSKKNKDPFGAVGTISTNMFPRRNKMEPHFVFSNSTSKSKLPTFMFDPLSDQKKDGEGGTLETTEFGNVLAKILRDCGSDCAARLLSLLTQSKGFFHHNQELHAENGVFLVEGDQLSPKDEESLTSLTEAAKKSSEVFQIEPPSPKKLKTKQPTRSRGEINKQKLSVERKTILEADTGMHKTSEMCHEGLKLHPLKNLVNHPDVIRNIDNVKVETLYNEMKLNLDASQIIFKAQVPIKKQEDFDDAMVSDNSLILRVVSGRHRLIALQKLYEDGDESRKKLGKLLNGDENADEIMVPVVVLSISGNILANYEHLKTESSNQQARKVLLQDYIFLYVKLLEKLKDVDRCLDIIRRMMVITSQATQQTINGVLGVCRLPAEALQLSCDVMKMKGDFGTIGQKTPTFLQRKFNLKQTMTSYELKVIAKTPTAHLIMCSEKLLSKAIGWKVYISSCADGTKMKKLIKLVETQSQRPIEQLQREFPVQFGEDNLTNFLNEDNCTVKKFISNTVSHSQEEKFDKYTVLKTGDEVQESDGADVFLLHMDKFEPANVEYLLNDMVRAKMEYSTLLVICKTINEVLAVSRIIDAFPPIHEVEFSNVLHFKKPSPIRLTSGYKEGLDSVVVCGRKCRRQSAVLLKHSVLIDQNCAYCAY